MYASRRIEVVEPVEESPLSLMDGIQYALVDRLMFVPSSTFNSLLWLPYSAFASTSPKKIGGFCCTFVRNELFFNTYSKALLSSTMSRLGLDRSVASQRRLLSKKLLTIQVCFRNSCSRKSLWLYSAFLLFCRMLLYVWWTSLVGRCKPWWRQSFVKSTNLSHPKIFTSALYDLTIPMALP